MSPALPDTVRVWAWVLLRVASPTWAAEQRSSVRVAAEVVARPLTKLSQVTASLATIASSRPTTSGPDPSTFVMVTCLIGVPLLTAILAFIVVELSMRDDGQSSSTQLHDSTPRPTPSTPGMSAQSLRSSKDHAARQHPASNSLRAGLLAHGPVSAPRPTETSPPRSLRTLFQASSAGRTAEACQQQTGPLLAPPTISSLAEDECSISPLSLTLIVKNSAGTHVRFDGDLLPLPESRTLNVVSLKDNQVMIRAHVSETGQSSTIRVETKAKSIPVAVLDTSEAIAHRASLPDWRCRVVFHTVIGEERGAIGPPCAWIGPTTGGAFMVHYTYPMDNSRGSLSDAPLMVYTKRVGGSSVIERMLDPQGQVVSRTEAIGSSQKALWVRQGHDMAFVVCIALAIQKLA